MAIIFRDSFDTYTNTTEGGMLRAGWTGSFGDYNFATGRFGDGQCLYSLNILPSGLATPTFTAATSFTFECGLRAADPSFSDNIWFYAGSTTQITVNFDTSGVIRVYRGTSTLLGSTAASSYNPTSWHTFQMEGVISDTVGRVTIYIDGVQVLNLTGLDTANGTTAGITSIGLRMTGYFDDMLVRDVATRGDPLRASTIYPDSDGATLDFTPSTGSSHYGVVDEAVVSTTDYLTGSTVGHVDELGLGALPITPVDIEEIVIRGVARKTDAGPRAIALGVKSDATVSDGSDIYLTSSFLQQSRVLTTDPATSAAWTKAGVDALQLRPKVTV